LDRTSEGLILVTNDGELANRLTHPRYGIEKVYRVRVAGNPTAQELGKLRKGIYLSDGMAQVSSIQIKRRFKQSTELEIVLKEGRNREIRRILARIGHKVMHLKRVAIGPIRLGTMPVGAHRMLSRDEVQALRKATKRTRKTDAAAKPSIKERRPSSPATSSTSGSESQVAKPRRRKTGSSAMRGYTRPTKKGVQRKKSSADLPRGSQKSGSTSQSARDSNSDARPGKKTAKRVVRSSKPPATNKKAGRPGKRAGKPSSVVGKKKTGRKRRR
jgi:23S rRNA pseudouridine2605 synthase